MSDRKTKRFSKTDDSKLRKLWSSHATEEEIARQMGHASRWVIRRRAIKLGLPSSRREVWDKELA